jgi:hypothetical protein
MVGLSRARETQIIKTLRQAHSQEQPSSKCRNAPSITEDICFSRSSSGQSWGNGDRGSGLAQQIAIAGLARC